MKVQVKIKRLRDGARIPKQMTDGSAGMDLFSCESCWVRGDRNVTMVPTGIAVSIPYGYEGQIRPRSGLAAKYGISVLNSPGTIDSDYRGEIKVLLTMKQRWGSPYEVKAGERIAQLVIAPIPLVEIVEVEELDDTIRGSGGFGSTGGS